MRAFLALTALALLTASARAEEKPAKPKLALHVGKIITCAGQPIVNGTILVSNGKIEAIGPRAEIKVPAGYTEIDQGDKLAIPGLDDVHRHVGRPGHIKETIYQPH